MASLPRASCTEPASSSSASMVNVKHPAVRKANAATSAEIQLYVPKLQPVKDKSFLFQVATTPELPEDLRREMWLMFEANMRSLYEGSSFGWDPSEKRLELFHSLSRFVMIWPDTAEGDRTAKDFLAYAHYRFEREDRRSVIYCYELQVAPNAQRLGLGRALVESLGRIARGTGMSHIMLTGFKQNAKALKFYKSAGFSEDPTSPGYVADNEDGWEAEDDDSDYRILSKTVS